MKKLLAVLVGLLMSMSLAFAVDVNSASQQELETIKGIGPALSSRIVEERRKGGNFKDMADLESRVKGVGENNAKQFAEGGLTVGGGRTSSARSAASTAAGSAKGSATAATAAPAMAKDAGKAAPTVAKDSVKDAADKGRAMAGDKASAATDKAKASAASVVDKAKAPK